MTTVIDLGWCVGKLAPNMKTLTIISPSQHGEDAYTPAESVQVYGEAALKALRDTLIAAYPVCSNRGE